MEELWGCAREFGVRRGADTIHLTRYRAGSFGGAMLPNGEWWAYIAAGGMNPWYLGMDGRWRYKAGDTWPSVEALVEFLETGRVQTLAESHEEARRAA